MNGCAMSKTNGTKRKTITFLPAVDVDAMLNRAWTNERGEVLWAQKTRVINELLREAGRRRGLSRKRDLQPIAA